MPKDIYHSQYIKDYHNRKVTTDYTREHNETKDRDVNKETYVEKVDKNE